MMLRSWFCRSLVSCLVLFATIPLPAQSASDSNDIGKGLAALLEYAQAMHPPAGLPGTVREVGPDNFLRHPYAARSLIKRMMDCLTNPDENPLDLEKALLEEIRDAQRVESILEQPGEGLERLRALVEIHPLTIMSRNEIGVLMTILREMIRAGYPRESAMQIFGLIRELEPFVSMNPDFPSVSSRLLEVERLCLLARHGKVDPEMKKAALALVKGHPFDREALYGAACMLALTHEPEEAKEILARLALLDPQVSEKVAKDPDLAEIRNDATWFDKLGKGQIRPLLRAAPNPGIEELSILYNWGGMGKKVNEAHTISWQKDRYVDRENRMEIPAELVALLVKALEDAHPSDSMQSRITHFDDYPTLKMTLTHSDGARTLLYSNSNAVDMLPFNIAGKKGLQVNNSRLAGQTVQYLLSWLGIERGSPRASFYFGGMEIPKGERQQQISTEEMEFRKAAGLPENPPPVKPEPLPPELAGMQGKTQHLMGSYVVDWDGNIAAEADRYAVIPQEGEPGCAIELLRVRRGNKTLWYPEAPDAFRSHADKVWKLMQAALGKDLKKCQIRLWVRSIDEDGFPSGMDLAETLNLLSRIQAEFSALGPTPVRNRILAETPSLSFDGNLLLGSGTVYSTDFEFNSPPFDHSPAAGLLAWAGIGTAQATAIQRLALLNDMLYVDLVASPSVSDLEAMKHGIASAGRTIEEVRMNEAQRRWLVKPAAGELLHALIRPDGSIDFGGLSE
ncbi:MAG TPA: hypothetical protein PKM25_05535 [Candidatus Ozemobacteraceae bacterium]|nr:hypothetical protein [Candidatus Ozemobacteraceae bacterium]